MQSAIVSVHLFSIFVIIAGWVKAKGQRSLHFFNFCCPQFGYAGLVSLLFFSVSQQSIAANRLGPNLGAFETNGWAKCPDAPGFFGAFPGPNLLKPKGWFLVFPLPVFLVQIPRIGVNPSGWSSGQSCSKEFDLAHELQGSCAPTPFVCCSGSKRKTKLITDCREKDIVCDFNVLFRSGRFRCLVFLYPSGKKSS